VAGRDWRYRGLCETREVGRADAADFGLSVLLAGRPRTALEDGLLDMLDEGR
jgi:hypothetical protein